MDRKLLKITLALTLLSVLPALAAGRAGSRLYTDADGFVNTRICDIMEDSRGMIWIATWIGVDRFDGLSFRKFRSYPEDDVKLDNNRIERVFETENGDICIATYGDKIFRINPLTGRFEQTALTDADLARYPQKARASTDADGSRILNFTDSKGGLWMATDEGLRYSAPLPKNPLFVSSRETTPVGHGIHALYADREGRLWSGSRDGRVVVFDTRDGAFRRIGNLTDGGSLTADSTAVISARPYSFFEDRKGRIWIGTKSGQLRILTPRASGGFDVRTYLPDDRKPGALRCADVYDFAEDRGGCVWLATFGGGPALAEEQADGSMRFTHLAGYPPARALVRKLLPLPDGQMAAACPYGLIIFSPDEAVRASKSGKSPRYVHHSSESQRSSSLSNNDILNMMLASGDTLWLASYSGGVDFALVAALNKKECAFGHASLLRDGSEPLVQTVMRTENGAMYVSTAKSLSVYSPGFGRRLMHFDSGNLGFDSQFTEASPQRLADGRIVYGMGGGLMVVDPAHMPEQDSPEISVTSVRSEGLDLISLPRDSVVRLKRGFRDLRIGFAALEYAAPADIDYFYRRDGGDWSPVSTPGELFLMNLPAGKHTIELRSTDRYGNETNNTLAFRVEVPYKAGEIIFFIVFGIGILVIIIGTALLIWHYYRVRRLKARLAESVKRVLSEESPGDDLLSRIEREVGSGFRKQDFKVENVARALSADRGSIRAELKRHCGVTFEDYLRRVRVAAAARMLRSDEDLNVSQVAYACGFRSSQYMAMVFKELTGRTPTEYARK